MKPSILNFKSRFTRKRLIEPFGILFAVALAAILGNYVARIAARQIDDTLTIYIVGIFIGLFIGILVGIYVKRGWSKLIQHIQK